MRDINLTSLLLQRMQSYPRKRGRYSPSEIYGILYGFGGKKTTPEEWMNPKPKAPKDAIKMWTGTIAHDQIQRLLKREGCEIKKEYPYRDIVLAGKADYHVDPLDPTSDIWEFKTADKIMEEAKDSHEHQAKLYCTMFDRPRTRIFQPLQTEDALFLKEIGVVTRDDEWFAGEMEKLYEFHLKVEPLWQKIL